MSGLGIGADEEKRNQQKQRAQKHYAAQLQQQMADKEREKASQKAALKGISLDDDPRSSEDRLANFKHKYDQLQQQKADIMAKLNPRDMEANSAGIPPMPSSSSSSNSHARDLARQYASEFSNLLPAQSQNESSEGGPYREEREDRSRHGGDRFDATPDRRVVRAPPNYWNLDRNNSQRDSGSDHHHHRREQRDHSPPQQKHHHHHNAPERRYDGGIERTLVRPLPIDERRNADDSRGRDRDYDRDFAAPPPAPRDFRRDSPPRNNNRSPPPLLHRGGDREFHREQEYDRDIGGHQRERDRRPPFEDQERRRFDRRPSEEHHEPPPPPPPPPARHSHHRSDSEQMDSHHHHHPHHPPQSHFNPRRASAPVHNPPHQQHSSSVFPSNSPPADEGRRQHAHDNPSASPPSFARPSHKQWTSPSGVFASEEQQRRMAEDAERKKREYADFLTRQIAEKGAQKEAQKREDEARKARELQELLDMQQREQAAKLQKRRGSQSEEVHHDHNNHHHQQQQQSHQPGRRDSRDVGEPSYEHERAPDHRSRYPDDHADDHFPVQRAVDSNPPSRVGSPRGPTSELERERESRRSNRGGNISEREERGREHDRDRSERGSNHRESGRSSRSPSPRSRRFEGAAAAAPVPKLRGVGGEREAERERSARSVNDNDISSRPAPNSLKANLDRQASERALLKAREAEEERRAEQIAEEKLAHERQVLAHRYAVERALEQGLPPPPDAVRFLDKQHRSPLPPAAARHLSEQGSSSSLLPPPESQYGHQEQHQPPPAQHARKQWDKRHPVGPPVFHQSPSVNNDSMSQQPYAEELRQSGRGGKAYDPLNYSMEEESEQGDHRAYSERDTVPPLRGGPFPTQSAYDPYSHRTSARPSARRPPATSALSDSTVELLELEADALKRLAQLEVLERDRKKKIMMERTNSSESSSHQYQHYDLPQQRYPPPSHDRSHAYPSLDIPPPPSHLSSGTPMHPGAANFPTSPMRSASPRYPASFGSPPHSPAVGGGGSFQIQGSIPSLPKNARPFNPMEQSMRGTSDFLAVDPMSMSTIFRPTTAIAPNRFTNHAISNLQGVEEENDGKLDSTRSQRDGGGGIIEERSLFILPSGETSSVPVPFEEPEGVDVNASSRMQHSQSTAALISPKLNVQHSHLFSSTFALPSNKSVAVSGSTSAPLSSAIPPQPVLSPQASYIAQAMAAAQPSVAAPASLRPSTPQRGGSAANSARTAAASFLSPPASAYSESGSFHVQQEPEELAFDSPSSSSRPHSQQHPQQGTPRTRVNPTTTASPYSPANSARQ